MQLSPIEWTHYTANPLRYRDPEGRVVHACVHKSTGCLHCYAETLAPRWGRAGKKFTAENMKHLTPLLDEKELHQMLTHKPASGKMCFVGDMTDVFGEWVPFELLDKLFAAFAVRPDVVWQVLTKRPERMLEYLSNVRTKQNIIDAVYHVAGAGSSEGLDPNNYRGTRGDLAYGAVSIRVHDEGQWPLANVWLGVSVENQQYADERIPLLLQTPAAKRFVSYEPAIGGIDISEYLGPKSLYPEKRFNRGPFEYALDWVICGGESGPGARSFHVEWARSVVSQCREAGVACFVKQFGSKPTVGDREFIAWNPNVTCDDGGRIFLKDRKGGDMSEWPADLRVRQFPA